MSRSAWAVVGVLLAALGSAALVACGGSAEGEGRRCNGSEALCERRVDQVVVPATHNSYAASEQPGWRFASQRFGIARQLEDGIRGLLLDVHHGVRRPGSELIWTDLRASGGRSNKAADALPPAALEAAERAAGQVGGPAPEGERGLYLCHTLCELGAEPLVPELVAIREFVERNPGEVLFLIVEDYVAPAEIAAAFEQAGLASMAAALPRSGPQPTLGELLDEGKHLLVFSEEEGGEPPWYMPAFSYISDTPLGARRPDELSCAAFRGEPGSPLLLINHWIPPFPPSPRLNALIGRAPPLARRVRSCMRERGAEGAILAVDFYERTAVVRVARELNAAGASAGGR